MKTRKKRDGMRLLMGLLSLMMLLALAACGGAGDPSETTDIGAVESTDDSGTIGQAEKEKTEGEIVTDRTEGNSLSTDLPSESTSASETAKPEERDIEGELVISSAGFELPIVDLNRIG